VSDPSGHRQRLKKRFAENGFSGFHDYEILELVLFYAIPQKDTKPLAKSLLKSFGSMSKVLDAAPDELASVDGCGPSTALYLYALRSLFAAYANDSAKQDATRLTTMSGLVEYLRAEIGNRQNEVLFAIFLNAANEVLATKEMSEGTVNQAAAYPRRIVEEALKCKATSLILAHNHPGGIAEPSEDDLRITEEIRNALALVEVSLQEHIILAGSDYFSFSRNGLL
jgi:DNA repair protein RadC